MSDTMLRYPFAEALEHGFPAGRKQRNTTEKNINMSKAEKHDDTRACIREHINLTKRASG